MKIPLSINSGKINGGEETVSFITPSIKAVGKKLMIRFYNFRGNKGWKQTAGKNGVKQLLKTRPYVLEGA